MRGETGQNTVELGGMDIESGLGPDDVICEPKLLFHRPLRLDALVDLVSRPTPLSQAPTLGGSGASDANGRVQLFFRTGFEEERDHHRSKGLAFPTPGFDLGAPKLTNAWMQDVFKLLASRRVSENVAGKFGAEQTAVRTDELRPERSLDFIQGGLAGFHHLPRQGIGVDDRDAALSNETGAGGLAHANATGHTNYFHQPASGLAGNARPFLVLRSGVNSESFFVLDEDSAYDT